jgi:hypothetical protein
MDRLVRRRNMSFLEHNGLTLVVYAIRPRRRRSVF